MKPTTNYEEQAQNLREFVNQVVTRPDGKTFDEMSFPEKLAHYNSASFRNYRLGKAIEQLQLRLERVNKFMPQL